MRCYEFATRGHRRVRWRSSLLRVSPARSLRSRALTVNNTTRLDAKTATANEARPRGAKLTSTVPAPIATAAAYVWSTPRKRGLSLGCGWVRERGIIALTGGQLQVVFAPHCSRTRKRNDAARDGERSIRSPRFSFETPHQSGHGQLLAVQLPSHWYVP